MNHQALITPAGFDRLKAELADFQDSKRPKLVERLSLARSMGDLSENSDYQDAKEELSFMDGQIAELEELTQNAKVATPTDTNQISFGHTVKVKIDGHEATFQIVGEWEADPMQKKISHSSPLGLALMGKKVGEKVEVDAPAGKVTYTIVDIS